MTTLAKQISDDFEDMRDYGLFNRIIGANEYFLDIFYNELLDTAALPLVYIYIIYKII